MLLNMKKITVFAIAYLFVVIVPSLAQVSWSVNNTEEFRNGDTMELICTVTGPCCSTSRIWNGGPSFSVLMNSGAPSDAAKYAEVVHSNSFSLLIYNMDRSDFLYDYRCSNGFDDSPRGLLSPPGNARYVPATSEIQEISSSTDKGSITFEVNVTTVFPAPSCTANFGGADLTSSMTTTSTVDFPFRFAEISMANVAYTCPGSLNVSCSVGSYSFNVLKLDPCKVTTEGSTEGLISATPSSETTTDMESSFMGVTGTVDISNVLSSFESTDLTFKLETSLNANTLSLEDSLSRISPFSTIGFVEPTELLNNEYMTTEIEVDSTLFSLKSLNFTDETIKTGLLTSAMSTSIVTSTRINLPISSASVLDITTGIALQVDLTKSQDLHIPTSEIIQTTQTRYTSLFNSVLLLSKTAADPFPSTLTARFDAKYIDTLSLQSSMDSYISSLVSKDKSDTFPLRIETSPAGPVLPVDTSSSNQIYTSGDPWSVSRTENVLVNTSNVDSFTSYDNSASVFQIASSTDGTSEVHVLPIDTTSVGQNYSSVDSFSPVEGFSISLFLYSSSLSQGQPVYTSFSQTLLLFDLSSVRQTVQSTDFSFNKVVSSSKSSSINSFKSFADTLTLQYTEWSANESISSMVDKSLHLSSLDNLVAFSSEPFKGNSQFSHFSGTSLSNQPELTSTPSVNYLTLTEVTPSINHHNQSDLLLETFTQVNLSVSQSSHISEVSYIPSADIFAKSKNVLSVDIFTLRQASQTLPLSTYSSIKYVDSLTIGQPFNTSFISTVIQITSTPFVTSIQMIKDTFSLSQFPDGTNLNSGTSSLFIKLSTVVRSATFHDVSLLSPSSSLNFASYTEFSSFSKIMSTNINNVATSNIDSIESSDTFYVSSSQPTSRPTQTSELSFREAQIIIISCSIAAVIFVIFVPLMVMYCLGKLPLGKIQNEKYANSEIDGFSSFSYPNIGKNITLRYHSRSLSDSPYTGDFENNWNSVTC